MQNFQLINFRFSGSSVLPGFHGHRGGNTEVGAGQGGGVGEHRQLRVHLGGGRWVRALAAEERSDGSAPM